MNFHPEYSFKGMIVFLKNIILINTLGYTEILVQKSASSITAFSLVYLLGCTQLIISCYVYKFSLMPLLIINYYQLPDQRKSEESYR